MFMHAYSVSVDLSKIAGTTFIILILIKIVSIIYKASNQKIITIQDKVITQFLQSDEILFFT
jgi:hypothetical protein